MSHDRYSFPLKKKKMEKEKLGKLCDFLGKKPFPNEDTAKEIYFNTCFLFDTYIYSTLLCSSSEATDIWSNKS